MTPLNYALLLDSVKKLLIEYDIPFKYVSNESYLKQLNTGIFGYSQIGKSLVIYMESLERLEHFMPRLKCILSEFKDESPRVPFAKEIGGGYPLYYRYGSFTSDKVQINGEVILDSRTSDFDELYSSISDPFEKYKDSIKKDLVANKVLLKYPIIKTISQSGKGGVFVALDLSMKAYTEVILKIGYRNGFKVNEKTDGISLIHREVYYYKKIKHLSKTKITPNLISHIETSNLNIMVIEKLPENNLLQYRLDDLLTLDHILQCVHLINFVHSLGLCLGDAKLANFIITDSGPYIIDLECFSEISAEDANEMTTYKIISNDLLSKSKLDLIHFYVSIIKTKEILQDNIKSRTVVLSELLACNKPKCNIDNFCRDQIFNIVEGINN